MSSATPPNFRVWIRRQPSNEGPFSIKFEVTDGKGILRVARPGVLIDPPARPSGSEDRLTGAQLRASRFLHVFDGGRGRQGHSLTRLDETMLDRVPLAEWIELVQSEDSALRYLFLPDIVPDLDEPVDDEPTSPRRILANLREDLSALTLEDAIEAGSATDEVPLDALPGDDDAAAVVITPVGKSHKGSSRGAGSREPKVDRLLTPLRPLAPEPAPVVVAAQEPDSEPIGAPTLERFSPLIRHLRRQVARQDAHILELQAELDSLRAKSTRAFPDV